MRDRPRSWARAPAVGSYGFSGVRNGAAGGERFAVVGLTELTTAVAGAGLALTRPLTDGGARTFVFNCGQSAFGYREFSTITVANGVAVLAAGRLTFGPASVAAHQVTGLPPQPWMAQEPPGPADYRAAVYVVVRLEAGEAPVAMAFLHNVYRERDHSAATMTQINAVAARIRLNRVQRTAHVYFGGDFNVPARNRGGRPPLFAYEASVAAPMVFPGARPGGTTWGGNLYDYWLSDINPLAPGARPPVASVSSATLDGPRGLMSDHAASILRLN